MIRPSLLPALVVGIVMIGVAGERAMAAPTAPKARPSVVKIVNSDGAFHLVRNGRPYFIKGVGGDASRQLLKNIGGNSLRLWSPNDAAHAYPEVDRLGLTIAQGIWLGHKDQGFDYNNSKQVADQFAMAKRAVLKYKNQPALLVWGIGNEMETSGPDDDPVLWNAVEAIAKMTKQLDPNHPTMTVIAELGRTKVQAINRYCPDIDIIGINSYAGCPSIPDRYKKAGGFKPYIITEFGPPGTWEWASTPWHAVVEPTSTEKADWYRKSYNATIKDQPLCLGSYAFAWGNKQEATSTWFGMLLPDGTGLGAVDAMSEMWTAKKPAVAAPVINKLEVTGPVSVPPGSTIHAAFDVKDPQKDDLKVRWVLQYDALSYNTGGGNEAAPPSYPDAIVTATSSGADVRMPKYGGGYRLYAYATNQHHKAAVANVALFVTGDVKVPEAQTHRSELPLVVYGDKMPDPAPFTPSGFMGNSSAITMDAESGDSPHTGATCLKVSYNASDNWAGVVWQYPANDWGALPGSWDLTGASHLTFWARGAVGGEVVSFKFGLLGANSKYPDSGNGQLAEVTLSSHWKQYSIDVSGQKLNRIKTGFVWVIADPGKPKTFYLDDIQYE